MASTGPLSDVRVSLVVATSADGKVSTRDDGGPRFSSQEDKRFLTRLRSRADAVVLGARTVANDDPSFRLPAALQEERRLSGRWPTPMRAVVSGRGSVRPTARLFEGHESPALVFVGTDVGQEAVDGLSGVASVCRCGEGVRVDPRGLLEVLRQEYGVRRVLLEGGPEVSGAFLDADLIDEMYVTVCPVLIGGRDVPSAIAGDGLPLSAIRRLRLLDVRTESEVYLHYAVDRSVARR